MTSKISTWVFLSLITGGFLGFPFFAHAATVISDNTGVITTAYSFDIPVGLDFPGPSNPAGGTLGWFTAYLNVNDTSRVGYFKLYDSSTPLDCQTSAVNFHAYYGIPEGNGDPVEEFTTLITVDEFTGTQCDIPNTISNYSIRAVNVSGSGTLAIGGASGYPFWTAYTGSPEPENTNTRIISVVPPDDPSGSSARATSTVFAFEAEAFVKPADFIEGMRLRITAVNNAAITSQAVGPSFSEGGTLVCSWLPNWLCPPLPGEESAPQLGGSGRYTFDVPITESGEFSFATTTDVQVIGRYRMTTEIVRPVDTFFGLSTSYIQFVSTTTAFTVATSTAHDIAVGQQVDAIIAAQEAYNPECGFDIMEPGDWLPDLQQCITSLFAVPVDYVADGLQGALQDLLSRAPWGYATRAYVIITGDTASSTLPSLAVDVPDGLPMAGKSFDFSPWEPTETALASLDTAVVETMEGSPLDNFLFWWNTMWLIMFALWLVREIYGIAEMGDFDDIVERTGFAGGKAHGRIRRASNGQRYQEYTTADVKRMIKKGERNGVIR